MAKRKKGKVVQMLSPENYIKQKARSLPIHECWIDSEWQDSGLVTIFVARKHTNGNLTVGIYLIDLKCLGVKDANYYFNISGAEYRDMLDHTNNTMDMEKVSYTLAHNIVFAGIEFAEDYGFKPHKDFGVAQYILEEDTDDIELMEIECGGENGKPLYVSGPYDNAARRAQIMAQLEKTAGKGNYDFLTEVGNDFENDDELDYDREDWEKEMDEVEELQSTLSLPEKIKMFQSMVPQLEKLSDKESSVLGYLSNIIIEEYTDLDKTEEIFDPLLQKINNLEISENPSDELLGAAFLKDGLNREEWAETFQELFYEILENPKTAKKKIKSLQKQMPENPAVVFLELNWLQASDSQKFQSQLLIYHKQFPDYPLIKIFWEIHLQLSGEQKNAAKLFENGPATFFSNIETWHEIEAFHFLLMLAFSAISEMEHSLIMVVDWLIEELELSELDYEVIAQLLFMKRIQFIMNLEA